MKKKYMISERWLSAIAWKGGILLFCFLTQGAKGGVNQNKEGFVENRGQITDQNLNPNPDVRFLLSLPGLNVQLKENGFSYDTYVTSGRSEPSSALSGLDEAADKTLKYHFHRIDVEFRGANTRKIIGEQPSADFVNFYTAGNAVQVRNYHKVIYKDIYPFIDLEFEARPGTSKPVEYNFILHPGADISVIRWKYTGSEKVCLKEGRLVIKTAHGELTEAIPLTYEKETGEKVAAGYVDFGNGEFGFNASYKKNNTLVIDPVPDIKWATFYGGSGAEYPYIVGSDPSGNVYSIGESFSATGIATAGAFQSTFSAGSDAFIAKFDPAGNRLWATYYGGSGTDYGQGFARDASGNIFLAVVSNSAGMATAGAYRTTVSGNSDVLLVKFDPSGNRLWATYYGGTGNDITMGMVTDGSSVYITGYTNSSTLVSTTGAYQTAIAGGAYDIFLTKFDASGSLSWGTYYGGSGEERPYNIAIDASANVYIAGHTLSTAGISTPGSYQSSIGGGADGLIAKFSSGGSRLWASYYGGAGTDYALAVAVDPAGNMYLAGYTASTSAIASLGAFQTTYGGGTQDAYLVKFDASGNRTWGTYYGGPTVDDARGINVDVGGNILMGGFTNSISGISTSGAYQTVFGGNRDGFVAKFNSSGMQMWGSYYGGTGEETPRSTNLDASGNIFLTGYTTSTSAMATAGAHQTVYGGGTYDGFLAGFKDLVGSHNAGINRLTAPSSYFCSGTQDVKVEIINAGINTINILEIAWQIDGVLQPAVSVTSPLAPGSTRLVTLGSVSFPLNVQKSIKVWTSLPNGATDTVRGNDTITVIRKPGLHGVYTIGGASPNYATFSAAVEDLNNSGVCGPVSFTVAGGTYNESIVLREVPGSSATNTIIFTGAGKNVTILSSSGTSTTDMTTLTLSGTDYCTFRNLTVRNAGASFGNAIWLTASADYNRFLNLSAEVDVSSTSANVNAIVASGNTTSVTTDGNTCNYTLFDSLEIKGGYHGIRINGPNTTSSFSLQNTVSNSTFTSQYYYGIYLRSQNLPVVLGNNVAPLRNNSNYSMLCEYSSNIEIARNIVIATDGALYLNNVNRNQVNNNFASTIYNNMFSSSSGYAFYSNQSSLIKLWHNSFSADPVQGTIRFVSSLNMELYNNHILSRSSNLARYAVHADNVNTFAALDYNNYYSAGGFVYIGPTDFPDLTSLKAASSIFNQNSYSQDPLFSSANDLHTSINLTGKYLGIDTDIDGDFRNTLTPVLGADEVNIPNNMGVTSLLSPLPAFCAGSQVVKVRVGNYGINTVDSLRVNWQVDGVIQSTIYISTPVLQRGFLDVSLGSVTFNAGQTKQVKVWTSHPNGIVDAFPKNDTLQLNIRTGLNGTYTIGNSASANYTSFGQAVNALNQLGVCSPVLFLVEPGIYNETVVIGSVRGASSVNTITFEGAGTSNTILTSSGTSTSNWITLLLDGADHMCFKRMSISAQGSSYGIGILLKNQADSNRFEKVTIQTNATSTSLNIVGLALTTSSTNLYATAGQPGDGNFFDGLAVSGGYYGIYLTGNSSYTTVSNSEVTNAHTSGIYCSNQDKLTLKYNKVNPLRNTSFSYAINLTNVSGFTVFSNQINTGGDYGMYVQMANFSAPSTTFRSSVYNNFISNSMGYAFYCENSVKMNIYHNSFKSEGSNSAIAAAVYFTGSSEINAKNNHIRNDNPMSFALSGDLSTFDSLDYNNYYSFGSFVSIGTEYGNLALLRNSLPQYNQNSYSQNPQYVSSSDLHTNTFLKGIYVGIDKDIDSENRCIQNVSVGADDERRIFSTPVIATSASNLYTGYPVHISHNLVGEADMEYMWYADGLFVSDSVELNYVFTTAGAHQFVLRANRCGYADSAFLNIQIGNGSPSFVVKGNNPDTLAVFGNYNDPGVIVTDLSGDDISGAVLVKNNLNTAVLGTYEYWYIAQDSWGNIDSVRREIRVIDRVSPQLILNGMDTLVIEEGESINEPGYTASDNYYSSVNVLVDSSRVNKLKVGVYVMSYTATDGSGNSTVILRHVLVVDTGLPVITLIGRDTIIVKVNYPYVEPGVKITDAYCSAGLSWEVDTYPNTSVLGDQQLTYTASDCEGNRAIPRIRIVRVIDNESPVIYLQGLPMMNVQRWKSFTDPGVSITDNFYGAASLSALLVTNSDVNVALPGTYSVCYEVTDPSGNRSNQACRVVNVIENTTSVAEESAIQPKLYPNPNSGKFTLDLGFIATEPIQLNITDLTGRLVYQTTLTPGKQETAIDTAQLAAGVYQVSITGTQYLSTMRMQILR